MPPPPMIVPLTTASPGQAQIAWWFRQHKDLAKAPRLFCGSALELRNLDVSRLVTGKNSSLSETEVADTATVYQLPKQLQMEHRVVESVLYSVAQ